MLNCRMPSPFRRLPVVSVLLSALLSVLLQAQTAPLTGVIEQITSQQQLNIASGELKGETVLRLSSVPAKTMRVYFPSNRVLSQVSLGGQPLRFNHQGGFLTIFIDGQSSAVNTPQNMSLSYSSKQESLQGPSPLFEIENYRLQYSLQTASGVFKAQSHFQLKGKKTAAPGMPTLPAPRTIQLALNRVFTVEAVQSGGRALAFQHRQGQLRIQLPGSLTPGRSYSLDVRYSGKLPAGNKYQIWDTPFGGGPYYYPAHPLLPGAY